MTRCYVSIGSNIDRERHIEAGLQALRDAFGELTISSIYESAPVGFVGEAFFNLAVGLDTEQNARQVWQQLRAIEIAQGRTADSKKFTSRTLDLDLLLYGDLITQDETLKLPRSDIEQYAFVLQPLAEIAPLAKHPVLQISYAELWQRMSQTDCIKPKIILNHSLIRPQ